MNYEGYKIVDFTNCKTCKYWLISADKEPCSECLQSPENLMSELPIKYEESKGETV